MDVALVVIVDAIAAATGLRMLSLLVSGSRRRERAGTGLSARSSRERILAGYPGSSGKEGKTYAKKSPDAGLSVVAGRCQYGVDKSQRGRQR